MTSPESFSSFSQEQEIQPKEGSRRSFIKKGLAFLTAVAVAPKEVFGQEAEQEKPIVDMVVEGQKVVLRPKDIERLQRSGKWYGEEVEKEVRESFDAEIQEAILNSALGEKLKQGLLKAQELGFQFNSWDTNHAHLLVDTAYHRALEKKYADNRTSKQETIGVIKEVKAIVFHCAEFLTKEQILDKRYLQEKHPSRSIGVDETNQAFICKKVNTKPLREGRLADFGVGESDYNTLRQTNYEDLAVIHDGKIGGFSTDITFLPDEKEGVALDPKLPKLKFVFTGYKKPKQEK